MDEHQELIYKLNKYYIGTGKYLAVGDTAAQEFVWDCLLSVIVPSDTPLGVARDIYLEAWWLTDRIRGAYYDRINAMYQFPFDTSPYLTQEESQKLLREVLMECRAETAENLKISP